MLQYCCEHMSPLPAWVRPSERVIRVSAESVVVRSQAPNIDTYVLDMCSGNEAAYRAICALAAKHDKFESGGELILSVPAVEQILGDHQAALAAAKGAAGSSVNSVLSALDADVLLSKGSSGSDKRSSVSDSSEPPEFGTPPAEATMNALRAHNFKAWCAAFSALPLSTREGRLGAFAKSFEGNCMLASRVACSKAVKGDPLAPRDQNLAMLSDLRVHRLDYFNFCLRVELTTGKERVILKNYSLAAPDLSTNLLDSMLDFKPHETNLMDPPHGFLAYKQALDGRPAPQKIDRLDHYCIPEIMEDFGEWLQRFYSAVGYRRTIDETVGFSVEGFCLFYAKHLRMATRLATKDEQVKWLSDSVMQFKAVMLILGTTTRSTIGSSALATASLALVLVTLPDGSQATVARPAIERSAAPVLELLRMQESLDTMTALRQDWSIFLPSAGTATSHDATRLPRLSEVSRKRAIMKVHGGEVDEPGSRAHTARLTPDGDLLMNNVGFPLGKAAMMTGRSADCRVTCWPFIFARCNDSNRAAYCPFWGQPDHESLDSAAHRTSFDSSSLSHSICYPVGDPTCFGKAAPVAKAVTTASAKWNLSPAGGRGGKPFRPPAPGKGRGKGLAKGKGPPVSKGLAKGIAKGQKGRGAPSPGRKGPGPPWQGRGSQRGRGRGGRGGLSGDFTWPDVDPSWADPDQVAYQPLQADWVLPSGSSNWEGDLSEGSYDAQSTWDQASAMQDGYGQQPNWYEPWQPPDDSYPEGEELMPSMEAEGDEGWEYEYGAYDEAGEAATQTQQGWAALSGFQGNGRPSGA